MVKLDLVDDGDGRVVAEGHVVEDDLAGHRRQSRGVGGLLHVRFGVEQRPQLEHRGLPLLVGVVLLDQELDGGEETVQVQEELDQGADGEAVVQHHVTADGQQDGLAEDAHQLRPRAVDRVDEGRVVVGVPVLPHHVPVVDHVAALPVVGGDDPHPVEALGQIGHDVGDPVTDLVVAGLRSTVEPHRHRRQNRNHENQGDEGQPHVGGEEEDRDDHHGQALYGELGQPVLQELLEVLDVAGHPGHDHARLLGREEVERQPLQVGEYLDPEVVHDAGRQPARHSDLRTLADGADRRAGQVGQSGPHHDAEVEAARPGTRRRILGRPAQSAVDGDLGQLGAHLEGHAEHHDEEARDHQHPGVADEEPPQGEAVAFPWPGLLGEDVVGLTPFRFIGQEMVDASLQFGGDATEGQPGHRGTRRPGSDPATPTATEGHQCTSDSSATSSTSSISSAWARISA